MVDRERQAIYVLIGMETRKSSPRLGRPRAFDAEAALEQAMQVFWRNGYEGSSLADLTAAMGINRPSLYAAFGNKEALFRKVMDRYGAGPASHACAALREPTARGVAEALLRGTADMLGDPKHPRGCLGTHGALACGDDAGSVRQEMVSRHAAAFDALRQRFSQAKKEGDLPAGADPGALARYLSAICQGMSVQASNGATRKDLLAVVKTALRAWPS